MADAIRARRAALGLDYWSAQSLLHRIMTILFKSKKGDVLGTTEGTLPDGKRPQVHRKMFEFLNSNKCISLAVLLGFNAPTAADREFLGELFFGEEEAARREERFTSIQHYDKIREAVSRSPELLICTKGFTFEDGAQGAGIFLRDHKIDSRDMIQYHITIPKDTRDYHMTNQYFSHRANQNPKRTFYHNSGRYMQDPRRQAVTTNYKEVVDLERGVTYPQPGTPEEFAAAHNGAAAPGGGSSLATPSASPFAPLLTGAAGGASPAAAPTPAEAIAAARAAAAVTAAGGSPSGNGLTSKQRKELAFRERKAAEAAARAAGGEGDEGASAGMSAAGGKGDGDGGASAGMSAAGGEGGKGEAVAAHAGGEGGVASSGIKSLSELNVFAVSEFRPSWMRGEAPPAGFLPPPPQPMIIYHRFTPQFNPVTNIYHWTSDTGVYGLPLSPMEFAMFRSGKLPEKYIVFQDTGQPGIPPTFIGESYTLGGQPFGGKRRAKPTRRRKHRAKKTRGHKQRG
jgi:hypothetical protein